MLSFEFLFFQKQLGGFEVLYLPPSHRELLLHNNYLCGCVVAVRGASYVIAHETLVCIVDRGHVVHVVDR